MTLSVITPSYRPDLELCRDLHASLRRFGGHDVTHSVIVPKADRAAFAGIGDVFSVDQFLPKGFVAIPGNMWLNIRRPLPPARGWIVQQLIKLEAAARSTADVVLLVDSDIVFVRPLDQSQFHKDGVARFYRWENAVHERMPQHILWHQVARRLLGLPAKVTAPLHDYICWPMPWDPSIVRAMLARVEAVTKRPWQTAIAAELHFSEGILYGVYVDEVLGGTSYATDTMLSVAYSGEDELDTASILPFLSSLGPSDIAVMISAKSQTDLSVRRKALSAIV